MTIRKKGRTEQTSNLPPRGEQLDFLIVGEVLRPHGLRGELRMRILTQYPERLGNHQTLYVGSDKTPYRLLGMRRHRDAILLQLEGISSRDAADRLREEIIYIDTQLAVPLEEGEYYLYQLLGMHVFTEDARELGILVDVIETGANDVYVLKGPSGEILLPAIPDVIREVNVSEGRMVVHLLDGLLDE